MLQLLKNLPTENYNKKSYVILRKLFVCEIRIIFMTFMRIQLQKTNHKYLLSYTIVALVSANILSLSPYFDIDYVLTETGSEDSWEENNNYSKAKTISSPTILEDLC